MVLVTKDVIVGIPKPFPIYYNNWLVEITEVSCTDTARRAGGRRGTGGAGRGGSKGKTSSSGGGGKKSGGGKGPSGGSKGSGGGKGSGRGGKGKGSPGKGKGKGTPKKAHWSTTQTGALGAAISASKLANPGSWAKALGTPTSTTTSSTYDKKTRPTKFSSLSNFNISQQADNFFSSLGIPTAEARMEQGSLAGDEGGVNMSNSKEMQGYVAAGFDWIGTMVDQERKPDDPHIMEQFMADEAVKMAPQLDYTKSVDKGVGVPVPWHLSKQLKNLEAQVKINTEKGVETSPKVIQSIKFLKEQHKSYLKNPKVYKPTSTDERYAFGGYIVTPFTDAENYDTWVNKEGGTTMITGYDLYLKERYTDEGQPVPWWHNTRDRIEMVDVNDDGTPDTYQVVPYIFDKDVRFQQPEEGEMQMQVAPEMQMGQGAVQPAPYEVPYYVDIVKATERLEAGETIEQIMERPPLDPTYMYWTDPSDKKEYVMSQQDYQDYIKAVAVQAKIEKQQKYEQVFMDVQKSRHRPSTQIKRRGAGSAVQRTQMRTAPTEADIGGLVGSSGKEGGGVGI